MNDEKLKNLAKEVYEHYKKRENIFYAPSSARSEILFAFNKTFGFNQVKTSMSTIYEKLDEFEDALSVDVIMFVLKFLKIKSI